METKDTFEMCLESLVECVTTLEQRKRYGTGIQEHVDAQAKRIEELEKQWWQERAAYKAASECVQQFAKDYEAFKAKVEGAAKVWLTEEVDLGAGYYSKAENNPYGDGANAKSFYILPVESVAEKEAR